MKLNKGNYHIWALATVVLWALAYVFTRYLLDYLSAFSLGFLRYAVASSALIIFLILAGIKPPRKEDFIWIVLAGISGFGLYVIVLNVGSAYVSAATSSLIIATAPVFTAVLASGVNKEKLKKFQWAAIVTEFGGILIFTLGGGEVSLNRGILWLLAAAALLGSYNIILRRLTRKYPAIQATAYSILAGTVFLIPLAPGAIAEAVLLPPRAVIYLILQGVFSSALAYILWSKALQLAEKTSMASNYMFFTPMLTAIFGVFVVGEAPDFITVLGGIIILMGAVVFNKDNIFANNKNASRKEPRPVIAIAIDGPSGAGKSTIARAAAKELGLVYVDTGALYRAIGLFALKNDISDTDESALKPRLKDADITISHKDGIQRVYLHGEDVSDEIRRPEMSMAASNVSAMPSVRAFLLELQRELSRKHSVIMDGRDIGTVVIPGADLKIFLTASPEDRAKRRHDEFTARGESIEYEEVLRDIIKRDRNDSTRAEAPLRQAPGAILLDTTGNTLEKSIGLVLNIIKENIKL